MAKIHKTIKSLLTTACLLCSMAVSAYDFTVDGICYNIVSLSDLTCVVTDNGTYFGDVVIPENVTYNNSTLRVIGIGKNAFYGCSGLTSITIPNSVTSIGSYAFGHCSKLKSVTISNSVTSIGTHAFQSCTSLTSITIPNSVTNISNGAFNMCTSLKKLTFEDGTATLQHGNSGYGSGLFVDCPLESLYLGRNLSYNNYYYPFRGKTTLTELTIGNSVTDIASYAFQNCSGLASITIGNSVKSIKERTFEGCSALMSVTISNSVTSIGTHAFQSCTSLTSITIPNSVTNISKGAFNGCTGLKILTFEDGTATLKIEDSGYIRGLFVDCPLESLYLGRNLSYNDYSPFMGKTTITEVKIGSSVTNINNEMFSSCTGLKVLYSLATVPPSLESNNFTSEQYQTVKVHVPQGSLEAYKTADVWENFWNIQGIDTTGIDTVNADSSNTDKTYYDLQGRRLKAPRPGVNIVNGKKVLIKR